MKNSTKIILVCICIMGLGFLIIHRRVIKALIKNEPMPKAPKWHYWVKKENRRE